MNRSELRYALDAVLPHVGSIDATARVGVDYRDGTAYLYATDRYTFGVVRTPDDSPPVSGQLPTKEAKDLLRFVRPSTKATEVEPVTMLTRDLELHVAIPNDSAVFDLVPPSYSLADLDALFASISAAEVEWSQQIYSPELFGRFAKAGQREGDRLRLRPARGGRAGCAVLTLGEHFYGGIAGMTYEEEENAA